MKIFASTLFLSTAFIASSAAAAGRKAEVPDNKLHIACAMKAGVAWQLKPNESINTTWRRINRNQWEFSLSYQQKKAICLIRESGEIDSFAES